MPLLVMLVVMPVVLVVQDPGSDYHNYHSKKANAHIALVMPAVTVLVVFVALGVLALQLRLLLGNVGLQLQLRLLVRVGCGHQGHPLITPADNDSDWNSRDR